MIFSKKKDFRKGLKMPFMACYLINHQECLPSHIKFNSYEAFYFNIQHISHP